MKSYCLKTNLTYSLHHYGVTVLSNACIVNSCHINTICCRIWQSSEGKCCGCTFWNIKSMCTTSLYPMANWVACYIPILVDAVHCPPLDSDAGDVDIGCVNRSRSSRWNWKETDNLSWPLQLSQLVLTLTCFSGQPCDRVTDCTPSCIDCCQGDCVVTVLFQLFYSVAEIAISESPVASVLYRTLSWHISLPSHHVAVHWATGNTPGEGHGSGCCWIQFCNWHTWN